MAAYRYFSALAAVVILFFNAIAIVNATDDQPEQVHLSYGADESEMIVTWVTQKQTERSTAECEYGTIDAGLSEIAAGSSKPFTDGGPEQRVIYIHRATLSNLQPGQEYVYRCGSKLRKSSTFRFTAKPAGSDWSPRVAVFGDLGDENGQSIPILQREASAGRLDTILHVGDIAYDLHDDGGRRGDSFMRRIEPIAARVPYQVCVGNHEEKYNFSQYDNRFSMINSADGTMNNFFYTFNLGPARIIAFSTEFYFFIEYGWHQIEYQYRWLEAELQKANLDSNRRERPWIITLGHRPMYCSANNTADCTHRESIIRTGIPLTHSWALEKLFVQYGVDLSFWGHEHNYERLLPVIDRQVRNGTTTPGDPYHNPNGPVHVITGAAGCDELHSPFVSEPAEWSAFRSDDYGYTRMTIHNRTHLELEQFSVDQNRIIDHVMIRKDSHGPY